jgi:hypothetical protein
MDLDNLIAETKTLITKYPEEHVLICILKNLEKQKWRLSFIPSGLHLPNGYFADLIEEES